MTNSADHAPVPATPPPDQRPDSRKHANDWRVLLVVFTLAGVVESQAFGHLNAFRPLFLQQLGVPAGEIAAWTGILASLGFVIGLPLLPFWGAWADRYSRKLIIVRSAYVEGVLFSVAALSPNVWFLAVAQLLGGFVFGNTGVMLAMLADSTPRRRLGVAVGVASAGFPIGSSVGPLIGGYVAQTFGIRPLLFGDAVASALMGVAMTLIVHDEKRVGAVEARVGAILRRALDDILSSRVVVGLFTLYFLSMFAISVFTQFLPILLQRLDTGPVNLLPSMIGATLTAAGIAMAVTTPLWGRLGDLIGRWRVLPIILAALTLGIAAEGVAPHLFALQVSVFWVGLFQGGLGATVVALLALLAPEERRASILNFSLLPSQLSWFLGPLLGGALASVALRLPFYAGAGIQAAALVVALILARRMSRAGRADTPAHTEQAEQAMV
ncbi:MAG TPA: MFS transporter [Ktedonobacterales bacterium]|nr:MFS transporter [Ktedonobacterales bacterium]